MITLVVFLFPVLTTLFSISSPRTTCPKGHFDRRFEGHQRERATVGHDKTYAPRRFRIPGLCYRALEVEESRVEALATTPPTRHVTTSLVYCTRNHQNCDFPNMSYSILCPVRAGRCSRFIETEYRFSELERGGKKTVVLFSLHGSIFASLVVFLSPFAPHLLYPLHHFLFRPLHHLRAVFLCFDQRAVQVFVKTLQRFHSLLLFLAHQRLNCPVLSLGMFGGLLRLRREGSEH